MTLTSDHGLWFLIGVLGVWRVTHFITTEDGPWAVGARIRGLAGNGVFGKLLDCFACASVWVAVPWALVLAGSAGNRLMVWLALSGGALLIERVTAPAAPYIEAPNTREADHGMLR